MHRIITAALVALALAPVTAAARPPAPDVPAQIEVTTGHAYLVAHAAGVQIYDCTAGAWKLRAPRATLTDGHGKTIGTHYGGPTWEARDGSTVKAARDGFVNMDPTAIDWLRLKVTATTGGADGDRLSRTTFIQRIHTVGGVAPAGPCAAGETIEVPYTADYVFWR